MRSSKFEMRSSKSPPDPSRRPLHGLHDYFTPNWHKDMARKHRPEFATNDLLSTTTQQSLASLVKHLDDIDQRLRWIDLYLHPRWTRRDRWRYERPCVSFQKCTGQEEGVPKEGLRKGELCPPIRSSNSHFEFEVLSQRLSEYGIQYTYQQDMRIETVRRKC